MEVVKSSIIGAHHMRKGHNNNHTFPCSLLLQISSVDLLDKRGYLTVCLNLTAKEGSRVLLRKPEGIREWHDALKVSKELILV